MPSLNDICMVIHPLGQEGSTQADDKGVVMVRMSTEPRRMSYGEELRRRR